MWFIVEADAGAHRGTVDTACGPARIFVKFRIVINNGELVDVDPAVHGDVLVGYSGTTAVTTSAFQATLVAPNAKVSVANGVSFLGAIFAASVEAHQDSFVAHFPFNLPWI